MAQTSAPPRAAARLEGAALHRAVRGLIAASSKGGKGIPVAILGQEMRTKFGLTTRELGASGWRALLDARPDLYDLDPRGPQAHVRFLPEGFARLPL